MERPRETTRKYNQDSRSSGRVSNPRPFKYETKLLNTGAGRWSAPEQKNFKHYV